MAIIVGLCYALIDRPYLIIKIKYYETFNKLDHFDLRGIRDGLYFTGSYCWWFLGGFYNSFSFGYCQCSHSANFVVFDTTYKYFDTGIIHFCDQCFVDTLGIGHCPWL